MARPIDLLARRIQEDPSFLAFALADYSRAERLDERGLAARLGCGVVTLAPLRLCRRPRPGQDAFRADLGRVAARFRLDASVLVDAVRRSDALAARRRIRSARSPGGRALRILPLRLMPATDERERVVQLPAASSSAGR